MTLSASLWLFHAVYGVGLTLWLTLAVIDHLRAFREFVHAVGITMSMAPLRRPPAVPTILLTRAVSSIAWHRRAALGLLGLKVIACAAAWIGCYALIFAGGLAHARAWFNVALAAFTALLLAMHLAGLWFAYWIREDDLQRGHVALLIWSLGAFFLFNGDWA